jgi:hypothetical protein
MMHTELQSVQAAMLVDLGETVHWLCTAHLRPHHLAVVEIVLFKCVQLVQECTRVSFLRPRHDMVADVAVPVVLVLGGWLCRVAAFVAAEGNRAAGSLADPFLPAVRAALQKNWALHLQTLLDAVVDQTKSPCCLTSAREAAQQVGLVLQTLLSGAGSVPRAQAPPVPVPVPEPEPETEAAAALLAVSVAIHWTRPAVVPVTPETTTTSVTVFSDTRTLKRVRVDDDNTSTEKSARTSPRVCPDRL